MFFCIDRRGCDQYGDALRSTVMEITRFTGGD